MERKIILTGDGSHSISVPELKVAYHSIYGAIEESQHVFIRAGLEPLIAQPDHAQINIFEMGFGTGLNVLLSLIEAEKTKTPIYYETIDLFPLSEDVIKTLNYCQQLDEPPLQPIFEKIHTCEWEIHTPLTQHFIFMKRKEDLSIFNPLTPFHLIYFDAFAPNAQPELWTKEIFDKMYSLLVPGGILVTYCSKGEVRRNMIAAGFTVEKLPGPPGKREMLRARIRINKD